MAIQTGGLHHLAICVTDFERAKRFYTQTLGFTTVLEFPGAVIVDAGGALLGVREAVAETPVGDRFDPHRVGLDHLALTVEPAQLEELKRQLDAGDVPNNGIEEDHVLGATYISFYDPDGIAWELYAMPKR
jgi:glyoxylase I family protein